MRVATLRNAKGRKLSCAIVSVVLACASNALGASHYVDPNSANPTPPYTGWAVAARVIQDAVDVSAAGDEVVVTNGLYDTGGRPVGSSLLTNRVAVEKPLTLRSVNGPKLTIIQGHQGGAGAIRCVYLAEGALLSGFTLTNGAASEDFGGGVFCPTTDAVVTNCVLVENTGSGGGGASGGTLNNCTLADNLASGDESADGGGAYGSRLNNCTLVANSVVLRGNIWEIESIGSGGGAEGCVLNGCILLNNSAFAFNLYGSDFYYADVRGGGAAGCVLNNCQLTGNEVYVENDNGGGPDANYGVAEGGGAYGSTLNNCSIINNFGGNWPSNTTYSSGGGAYGSELNNCIVYFNTATNGANYDTSTTLNYCCTTPMPTNGFRNITDSPLLVDLAGGNLRLQSNSPCINAGNNSYTSDPDLDGNSRIAGGTVDIGAYEFQDPTSLISYAWLQQYGLPTDGSADFTDLDGDGMNNWQEWRCQTDATDPLSVLRLFTPTVINTNVAVTWQSVGGVTYFLERSTNLSSPRAFTLLVPNLLGHAGMTTYTDTNAFGNGPFFYRVGVR